MYTPISIPATGALREALLLALEEELREAYAAYGKTVACYFREEINEHWAEDYADLERWTQEVREPGLEKARERVAKVLYAVEEEVLKQYRQAHGVTHKEHADDELVTIALDRARNEAERRKRMPPIRP